MAAVGVYDKNFNLASKVKYHYLKKLSSKNTNQPGLHIIFLLLLINFILSIGIVFTNKILYKVYKFPPVTLACVHFAVTFLGLGSCWFFGDLRIKRISIIKVLPIAVAFCSFVVFTNLSLKYNSVGTYQILKCLGDPLLIILQTILYGKRYTSRIQLTLVIMVSGIVVNSIFDVGYNGTGITYGLIAVLGSTLYYMWIEAKQKELNVTPMQLLFYQAPISSLLLAIVVLYFETPWQKKGVFSVLTTQSAGVMFLSSLMACGVNVSVFYIIRHTSVVTYAVFSKLKTCVVILGGSFISVTATVLMANQLVGIGLTLFGTALYTILKLRDFDQERKKIAMSPASSSASSSGSASPSFKDNGDNKLLTALSLNLDDN